MVKAKVFKLAKFFEGEPKESDFKLVEEELPAITDGEIQIEALYHSVDPYMRIFIKVLGLTLGDTMFGSQVARVTATKHANYKIGDVIVCDPGWRSHSNVDINQKTVIPIFKVPELKGFSPSLGLGAVGTIGNTAYFGFLEICQPKEGETVVVSGAAGAVGNIVGQIAKLKVIGIAGFQDKVNFLEKELGFDKAINYKTDDIVKALKEAAPNGVDCYFDNVGGVISSAVLTQMNLYGRIAVCGSVSVYNDSDSTVVPTSPVIQSSMVHKQLKMVGFAVLRWLDRWMEGINATADWIAQGKLKVKETVTDGFENMPKAFIGVLRGDNTGKAVVKA